MKFIRANFLKTSNLNLEVKRTAGGKRGPSKERIPHTLGKNITVIISL